MKKIITAIILCFTVFITGCSAEEYTGDIIPLSEIPQYTGEQLTRMLKGKSKEELNLAWGEKDAWFTTHPVESWYVEDDDMKAVSVYYDENDMVENVICDYDPSPSGVPGKDIPQLKVCWNGTEAQAVVLSYVWTYTENGEVKNTVVNGIHPMEATKDMNCIYADIYHYGKWDNYGVTLYFDIEPDAIDGCWWPLEEKGNTAARPQPALNIYQLQSISYPFGNSVCQVTATWKDAGTVNYYFILVNDISEYNKTK